MAAAAWPRCNDAGRLFSPVLLAAPPLPSLQLAGETARADWSYAETAAISVASAVDRLADPWPSAACRSSLSARGRVEIGYLSILPLILAGLALALRRAATWALAAPAGSFLLALASTPSRTAG